MEEEKQLQLHDNEANSSYTIPVDSLVEEYPTIQDFKQDMNEDGEYYARRDSYIVEGQIDRGQGETRLRVTVWKAQEYQGKYIPDPNNERNKYNWYTVAKRDLDRLDEEAVETMAKDKNHFAETIHDEKYNYDLVKPYQITSA